MSDVTAPPRAARAATSTGGAVRAGAVSALVAAVANVVVLLVAGAIGADLVVRPVAGQPTETVGVLMVLVMTVGPMLVGTLLLALLGRRGRRAWSGIALAGLAAGILTMPAPFLVEAETSTRIALALMHLVAGVVWFVVLRRAQPSSAGA